MLKRSGLRSESCYKSDDEESCYESGGVAMALGSMLLGLCRIWKCANF